MTKTYAQVVKQIESLKVEAEKLRRREIDGVIARIKEAIGFYGLTAGDLGLPAKARRAALAGAARPNKRRRRRATAPAIAKYRDEAGNSWGGRGPRPKWLRDALASGKSLADFAV